MCVIMAVSSTNCALKVLFLGVRGAWPVSRTEERRGVFHRLVKTHVQCQQQAIWRLL